MSSPHENAPQRTLRVSAGDPEASGSATERAVVFYCPYCGEEDLRPEPEPRGAWRCVSCARVFTVTYVGLSRTLVSQ
jgi:predicted RNA-binding Zn-ribbon protein involved in translation (DUF1610 family)